MCYYAFTTHPLDHTLVLEILHTMKWAFCWGPSLTGHVVGSFLAAPCRQVRLGVTLVKLSLEDAKQAGDPVV